MKFVADESVDQQIVVRLRVDGHIVEAISELDPGISDEEVLSRATQQDAVLVTADKDFGELVYRQGQASTGIILLRLSGLSASAKAMTVSTVVRDHGLKLCGSFSVIDRGQVRIRKSRDAWGS